MDEIYVERDAGGLTPVRAAPYDSEDVLQQLLARYPDLLAGNQMTGSEPRRWLLVGREIGVPDALDGDDRFALDHLFVDQDGVPTLVEVKRASDTRIRREVVGQMLDYAANGLVYWRVDRLRLLLAARLAEQGTDVLPSRPDGVALEEPADAAVRALLGDGADVEAFWAAVEQNLRTGRVRLVFVADAIPADLQRIIEFLDGQLRDAEVLGVEVKMYAGSDVRAYVPRVVGRTASAAAAKRTGDPRTYAELYEVASPEFRQSVEHVDRWAMARGLQLGTARKSRKVVHDGATLLWAYPSSNTMQLSLVELRDRPGGEALAQRVLAACDQFGRTGAGVDYPFVDPTAIVGQWDRFQTEVLDVLVDGLTTA